MRRRHKSRYRWFPTAGTTATVAEDSYSYSDYEPGFIHPQPSRAEPPILTPPGDIGLFPLVRDETISEQLFGNSTGATLRDLVEGQDWLAKRLVGSVFIAIGGGNPASDIWYNVWVTCGIAVARAKETNPEEIDLDPVDFDPQAIDNSADSWMWRRSWVLSKPVQSGDRNPPAPFDDVWPNTNATGYGDIRSGTHIDVKSARRIRREERLWFIYKATGWDGEGNIRTTGAITDQPIVSVTADIRVLGAMRRGQTNKRL